jgi:hypothetical protein
MMVSFIDALVIEVGNALSQLGLNLEGGLIFMITLVVLLVSLLVFRGLGVLRVPLFLTWHDSVRWALSVMVLLPPAPTLRL